jgi:hypothetical protein
MITAPGKSKRRACDIRPERKPDCQPWYQDPNLVRRREWERRNEERATAAALAEVWDDVLVLRPLARP